MHTCIYECVCECLTIALGESNNHNYPGLVRSQQRTTNIAAASPTTTRSKEFIVY